MKFNELKINQQVLYKNNKSSVVHLYDKDKQVVITVNDDQGKPINLIKVKSNALKPYFCEHINGECTANKLSKSVTIDPCTVCKGIK